MDLVEKMAEAIITLDAEAANSLVREAIAKGIDPMKVLQGGLLGPLEVIGRKFEEKEYFLAELIESGEIAKKCLAFVTPYLPKGASIRGGTVVLGTVKDDIHDIGKSLVASNLRIHGFDVHDLGVNVPSMTFVERAEESGADIIGMSAFLTTTIPNFGDVISYLKDMGIRSKYRIIIGGANTSQELAQMIGADGWAGNAVEAVSLCKRLMSYSQKRSP